MCRILTIFCIPVNSNDVSHQAPWLFQTTQQAEISFYVVVEEYYNEQ
jgi:hypothetical protein